MYTEVSHLNYFKTLFLQFKKCAFLKIWLFYREPEQNTVSFQRSIKCITFSQEMFSHSRNFFPLLLLSMQSKLPVKATIYWLNCFVWLSEHYVFNYLVKKYRSNYENTECSETTGDNFGSYSDWFYMGTYAVKLYKICTGPHLFSSSHYFETGV